jgi:hypothetical protein
MNPETVVIPMPGDSIFKHLVPDYSDPLSEIILRVSVGDRVEAGEKLAIVLPESNNQRHIYAPVKGTVIATVRQIQNQDSEHFGRFDEDTLIALQVEDPVQESENELSRRAYTDLIQINKNHYKDAKWGNHITFFLLILYLAFLMTPFRDIGFESHIFIVLPLAGGLWRTWRDWKKNPFEAMDRLKVRVLKSSPVTA